MLAELELILCGTRRLKKSVKMSSVMGCQRSQEDCGVIPTVLQQNIMGFFFSYKDPKMASVPQTQTLLSFTLQGFKQNGVWLHSARHSVLSV